jgi:hypothetical protein
MRLVLFMACAPVMFAGLQAGVAWRKITPDLREGSPHQPVHIAGFGQGRKATAVRDDLFARCLALAAGKNTVVLCGIDTIGLFLEDVEQVRALVRTKAKRPVDVVVAATHNHEGPDTLGLWGPRSGVTGLVEAYNQFVIDQTAEAALAALNSLKGVRVQLAKSSTSELKQLIADNRPPVVNDAEITVLRLTTGRRRRPLATLVNWANHPEALGSRNTLISADYLAQFYKTLETLGGGTPVFLNGALGGMQSPLGIQLTDPRTAEAAPQDSFRFADTIGERLANAAWEAVRSAPATTVNRLTYAERRVKIPVANPNFLAAAQANLFRGRKPFAADQTSETVVGFLRLANNNRPQLEAAMIPGELYPELSLGGVERFPEADFPAAPLEPPVKQQMTAPYRMLIGLANDEIGYIIPQSEWDEKAPYLKGAAKPWYGEVNSLGPQAAPILTNAFRDLAKQ